MKELAKKIMIKALAVLAIAVLLYPFTAAAILTLAFKLRGH